MAQNIQCAPFGIWKSPITANLLTEKGVIIQEVQVDAGRQIVYYLETRPAEKGRGCIVGYSIADAKSWDILPSHYNVKSTVHEYGGAGFAVGRDGNILFTDSETKGVFLHNPLSNHIHPLIEANPKLRYADFDMHPRDFACVLAIQEDHTSLDVKSRIVLAHDFKITTLIEGADFYSHPKFSPDGEQISWLQWNHPDMPWTGTTLHTAKWSGKALHDSKVVAGRAYTESVSQPRWGPDGTLFFASDRNGYWQLYKSASSQHEVQSIHLEGMENAELAGPEWTLANSTYVPLTSELLAVTYTRNAENRVILVDVKSSTFHDPGLPFNDIRSNAVRRVSDTIFTLVAGTMNAPSALYLVFIGSYPTYKVIKKSAEISLPFDLLSRVQHITFPRICGPETGGESHAFYQPPQNSDYEAPPDTLPPLLVWLHGGPTAHVAPGLILVNQYWTSRGYAVANVNYTGSTGYGRAYRDRLNGKWGLADVADAASCVSYLASTKRIDPSRVGIFGQSAGGYGVLQAMCDYPDVWAGGVSLHGISGLKALAEDTHKFESRYGDRLLFEDDMNAQEREQVMRDRSPCFHAHKITAPLLLLQGSEDKVVPPDQARAMVTVIRERGGDVKLVVFEGEGHGFMQDVSIKRCIEEQEKWWAKTLLR